MRATLGIVHGCQSKIDLESRHSRRAASHRAHKAPGSRLSLILGLLLCVLLPSGLLTGCGQVITVTPTPTVQPTATVALEVALVGTAPTLTPAPYTPAPTPTPTVTPTPVLHTIQAGESLLAIASRYGVSVAAMQETNGILDPRALQVGQQLIVPRQEEFAENSIATATPTPLPVEVQNLHFSETALGGRWVLGEVLNSTGIPIEQVRVGVSLLDEDGEEVAQAQELVALDLVDVNETAPFAVLFNETIGSFDRYRVYPLSAVPAYVGSYYRDLVVEGVEIESHRYASYTIRGTIRNTGPEEAVSVFVVITAYDPMDRVVAMRQAPPDHNVVARGGETTFSVILSPTGGPVVRVVAAAQGRRLQEGAQ
jgi:LysM repeat protein